MYPPVALIRSVSEDSLVSMMRVYRPRPWISRADTDPTQDGNPDGSLDDLARLSLTDQNVEAAPLQEAGPTSNDQAPRKAFDKLPVEILELILDLLFGDMRAVFPNSRTTGTKTLSKWEKELRLPRRKELTNLALVNSAWTGRVQRRIYRHSTLLRANLLNLISVLTLLKSKLKQPDNQ